jgi:hypothetical protein
LPTTSKLSLGNIILNNNSIYSIQEEKEQINKDKRSVIFYTSPISMVQYSNVNNFYLEINLANIDSDIPKKYLPIEMFDISSLKNGQVILRGNELYQVQLDKEYDIIVQQDTLSNVWTMSLNPYTKKFLMTSGYSPVETLYFSVTSKDDPNILYRSLEFSIEDLLSDTTSIIPFICDAEHDPNNVSIYTSKYFDSYAHEII